MTSAAFFHNRDLVTLAGSYLSPKRADALFSIFFSKTVSFTLFVRSIREHTFCDRGALRFARKRCYDNPSNTPYLVVLQQCFPKIRELALATFNEPGSFALQLASDPKLAPIIYHSRYHLVCIQSEALRKVIDTLQKNTNLFKALREEGVVDKEKLKVALFQAIFERCNSAQAEEIFPWVVRGATAISDEQGLKRIIAQVKRINSEVVSQFVAESSQSQEEMTRSSLSQKRPASPTASQPEPKRRRIQKEVI